MSGIRHGATRRELQILEADERGQAHEQIARDLGISLGTVKHVVTTLATRHCGPDGRSEGAIRQATDRLLSAIRRHHPEICS